MTIKRARGCEFPPGTTAPASGTYEQLNVLGSVTGTKISVAEGQTLPAAPRGFTWRSVGDTAACKAAD